VRSSYGDLRGVRAAAGGAATAIFIYPRGPGDPAAEQVRDSFRLPLPGGGEFSCVASFSGKQASSWHGHLARGEFHGLEARATHEFSSLLGRVRDKVYIGRTAAGGVGQQIDLHGDGKPDVVFSETCGFVLQLRDGKVTAAEADRPVTITIGGKSCSLSAFTPRKF
jgi:hypothetical protein